MAITLKLKHTFETRVVYSSELIAETRRQLAEALVAGEVIKGTEEIAGRLLAADDEEFVRVITSTSLRANFRSELKQIFKDLQIKRCSPLRTEAI